MKIAFATPFPDKVLTKFEADEHNEFKMYLKRMEMLNKVVASDNYFREICMTELHHKHKAHQYLKTIM